MVHKYLKIMCRYLHKYFKKVKDLKEKQKRYWFLVMCYMVFVSFQIKIYFCFQIEKINNSAL